MLKSAFCHLSCNACKHQYDSELWVVSKNVHNIRQKRYASVLITGKDIRCPFRYIFLSSAPSVLVRGCSPCLIYSPAVSLRICRHSADVVIVGFEVFTAVILKNVVFWDVTPCDSCKNRRFGGTWRLHNQGDKNR
jgi:hypothetical protein